MKKYIRGSADEKIDLTPLAEKALKQINDYASQYGMRYQTYLVGTDAYPGSKFPSIISYTLESISPTNIKVDSSGKLISTYNPKWYQYLDHDSIGLIYFPISDQLVDETVEQAKARGFNNWTSNTLTWREIIDDNAQQVAQFSEECMQYEETGSEPESQLSMAKRAAQYALDTYYIDEIDALADAVVAEIAASEEGFLQIPRVSADEIGAALQDIVYKSYFNYFKRSPEGYGAPPNKYSQMISHIDKWHKEYFQIYRLKLCKDGSILLWGVSDFVDVPSYKYYCIFDGTQPCLEKVKAAEFKSGRDLIAFIEP